MDEKTPKKVIRKTVIDDLVFLGQGTDYDGTRHFIFEDPIEELFVIKTDSSFDPVIRRQLAELVK